MSAVITTLKGRRSTVIVDKVWRLADNCSSLQWLLFNVPLIAAQASELGALLLEHLG